jgi:biotin transport system ATP-binding protein
VKIESVGITHTYNPGTPHERTVLHDINLTLAENRIGIIGHNGSGKSTFIRIIDALLTPSAGELYVDGLSVRKDASKIRQQTGFLFTDPDAQIVMPTVREDVAFGLRKLKLPKDQVAVRVAAQLERFGLSDFADQPAHLLSGGQKQLLSLASVLVNDPKLVIMDEPTTMLDIRNARYIGSMINDLSQTVILTTHHLKLLTDFDRIVLFDKGVIAADGTPDEVIPFYEKLMDAPVSVEDL